ncbi:MAG: hypothetical protein U0169_07425 [Polyangiaceae bacterium]
MKNRLSISHARTLAPFFAIVAVLLAFGASCTSGFGRTGPGSRLTVFIAKGNTGSPTERLPLSFTNPTDLVVRVEARKSDGTLDTDMNGFVRLSSKPGSVVGLVGEGTNGRNVQMKNGVADAVSVQIIAAYGDARIWAEDIGYTPADPTRNPPPQCADGLDNDGNGLADYPLDPGCAFANDDAEGTASYATGASDTLFFVSPRIADVRGALFGPAGVRQGGTNTPFSKEQVAIDTGFRPVDRKFAFNTVVTRIAPDGFYVTDTGEGNDFGSVFAFTFSAPPGLRVCDRLKTLNGTAVDFFGFTELSFPTWSIQQWNPRSPDPDVAACHVPDPHEIADEELADKQALFRWESALVRLTQEGARSLNVSAKFGPEFPKAPDYAPEENATNCDLNKDGRVAFDVEPEKTCNDKCTGDPQCTEYSNFAAQSNFMVAVGNSENQTLYKMQVDTSSSAKFDPLAMRGKPLRALTGTLRYFSGGSQFTLEVRCDDDLVVDLAGTPMSTREACVRPRTEIDLNENTQ